MAAGGVSRVHRPKSSRRQVAAGPRPSRKRLQGLARPRWNSGSDERVGHEAPFRERTMANFNKVILAGNLTRDPQLSYLPSGTPAWECGMAINRKWRAQNGEMREDVCFVDLRCYG